MLWKEIDPFLRHAVDAAKITSFVYSYTDIVKGASVLIFNQATIVGRGKRFKFQCFCRSNQIGVPFQVYPTKLGSGADSAVSNRTVSASDLIASELPAVGST